LAGAFPYVCAGSDADPVIDAYYGLSDQDQQALLAFLQSLKLPELPGSVVPF
jgi:cytochrome c1